MQATFALSGLAGSFTVAEQGIADLLLVEGNTVVPIEASGVAKSADALVNGVEAEFKTITGTGANTLKNAIQEAAQQGDLIVVDARKVPSIGNSNAVDQILRAQGNVGNLQGRVIVFTKDGMVAY